MHIPWNNNLLTGHDLIDRQHQELFRRINALLDAAQNGKGQEAVIDAINFMETHVIEHFGDEEALQKESSFPNYEAHKAEHRDFFDKIVKLKKSLDTDGTSYHLLINALNAIFEWIGKHVTEMDKELAKHLNSRTKSVAEKKPVSSK
jgi:hemerythrin